MAPPTFVSYSDGSGFSGVTNPRTVSVTTQTGDRIVVAAEVENGNTPTTTAPSGNGNTFALVINQPSATNNAIGRVAVWTATEVSGATYNVSCPKPTGDTGVHWGFEVWVWRDSDGFGATASTGSAASTLAVTTQQDNSALCVGISDWNAVDGATRTRRTVNGGTGTERTYYRDSARYAVYAMDYGDAGTAGSKTVGYSAPTGQQTALGVVEVLGTAGGAPAAATPEPYVVNRSAIGRASNW